MVIEIDDTSWGEFAPSLKLSGAEFYDQLAAVRRFLSAQEQETERLSQEIAWSTERISNTAGDERDWLIEDHHLNLYLPAVYERAARSMASVGMLAPLVEALFKRFARVFDSEWPRREFVVDTIERLVRSHRVDQMPAGWQPVLNALFHYRNTMFHHGFEWPRLERDQFERSIEKSMWPISWFDQITERGQPWIFYMSDEFESRCLDVVEGIMQAVRAHVEAQDTKFWWETREGD